MWKWLLFLLDYYYYDYHHHDYHYWYYYSGMTCCRAGLWGPCPPIYYPQQSKWTLEIEVRSHQPLIRPSYTFQRHWEPIADLVGPYSYFPLSDFSSHPFHSVHASPTTNTSLLFPEWPEHGSPHLTGLLSVCCMWPVWTEMCCKYKIYTNSKDWDYKRKKRNLEYLINTFYIMIPSWNDEVLDMWAEYNTLSKVIL